MTRERAGIVSVWLAALVAAVAIGLLASPERQLTWVPIAMVMLVFVTALVQLAGAEPEGYIRRMALSLSGAAIVLAIASGVFLLLGAHAVILV
ncbi:hypothetical protein [Gulosibacter sp. 10]|uniref:hypothetical protein n=1 Tax=Gulosibacter sp. 10 TaxID=1255570 RepID=UPI00111FF882|nr:hypothetical protein [Gulosibacter sp. 10]